MSYSAYLEIHHLNYGYSSDFTHGLNLGAFCAHGYRSFPYGTREKFCQTYKETTFCERLRKIREIFLPRGSITSDGCFPNERICKFGTMTMVSFRKLTKTDVISNFLTLGS